jgi:hypothetical protein
MLPKDHPLIFLGLIGLFLGVALSFFSSAYFGISVELLSLLLITLSMIIE